MMFNKKKVVLPLEGDLLFNKDRFWSFKDICVFIISGSGFIRYLFILIAESKVDFPEHFLGAVTSLIFCMYLWLYFSLGFKEETYKGYYFHDRLVFYRISKFASEYMSEKKSKEQLILEKEQLEQDSIKHPNGVYNKLLRQKNIQLDRAENPDSPFKIEIEFSDIEYIVNGPDFINIVKAEEDDKKNRTSFYSQLELAQKYNKNRAEVVEFLNNKIREVRLLDEI